MTNIQDRTEPQGEACPVCNDGNVQTLRPEGRLRGWRISNIVAYCLFTQENPQ